LLIYILLSLYAIVLFSIRNTIIYSSIWYRRTIIFLSFLMMLMLSAYRSIYVGTDYLMYFGIYRFDSPAYLSTHFIEPGYIFLNSLAQSVNYFPLITSICLIIYFLGMYMCCNTFKMNSFVFLSMFILTYTYFVSWNLMRQAIAVGFVCMGIALYYKLSKHILLRYMSFFTFVIIAQMFHSSAIFCFIFIFLDYIKVSYKFIFMYYVIIIYLFFTNFIGNLSNLILSYFPNYAIKYANSLDFFVGNNQRNVFQFGLIIIQLIFIHLYMIHNRNSKINRSKEFVINGYLLSLLLSTGGTLLISRVKFYMVIFFLCFTCLLLLDRKRNNDFDELNMNWNSVKVSYLTFLFLYYYLELIVVNNGNIVPFQ
jgi:hypothetical protein